MHREVSPTVPDHSISDAQPVLKIMMTGILPLDIAKVKGGVEAVIINLFEGFRQLRDVEVVHVVFTKEIKEPRTIQYAPNIRIRYFPFISPYELLDYVLNRSVLNQVIHEEQPDVIHIQEITPQLLRFLHLPRKNIVVTQHGIMREEYRYASGLAGKLKALFKVFVERFIFPRFRNIIFISEYNRNLLRSTTRFAQKIINPVNTIFFEQTDATEGNAKSLMYVGVLSRRKNIAIVIEALGQLKVSGKLFELHVAGGFKDTSYELEIKALVEKYGLNSQIHFHGWLTQAQIKETFRQCALFVLPSLQETLPVSIAEAMTLGKVVIASNVGAVREMFTDGVSGFLFDPRNTAQLVAVLNRIHEHSGLSKIAAAARSEALKFHPVTVATQTVEFYTKIARASEYNN